MNKYLIAILLLSVLLVSCTPKMAQQGDTVTVEYVTTLADGTPFDKSSDYDIPITFVVGEHKVLTGLETTVLGMKEGEQKEALLRPEEAFGLPIRTKIEMMPLNTFPSGTHLQKGMMLPFTDDQNQNVQGKVVDIANEGVTVDFNHPMAGKSLWLNVTVVKIEKKR